MKFFLGEISKLYFYISKMNKTRTKCYLISEAPFYVKSQKLNTILLSTRLISEIMVSKRNQALFEITSFTQMLPEKYLGILCLLIHAIQIYIDVDEEQYRSTISQSVIFLLCRDKVLHFIFYILLLLLRYLYFHPFFRFITSSPISY